VKPYAGFGILEGGDLELFSKKFEVEGFELRGATEEAVEFPRWRRCRAYDDVG
jgi:hypothetical protein